MEVAESRAREALIALPELPPSFPTRAAAARGAAGCVCSDKTDADAAEEVSIKDTWKESNFDTLASKRPRGRPEYCTSN